MAGKTDQEKTFLTEGRASAVRVPGIVGTEGGDFPHFGPFAPITDLSKQLFNLDSELDESPRSCRRSACSQ